MENEDYARQYPIEETINFLDYWKILWKNKWWIIFIVTFSTIVMGYITYKSPKTYLAEGSILVLDSQKNSLATTLGGFSLGGMGIGGNNSMTIVTILTSKTIAKQVIHELNIIDFVDKINSKRSFGIKSLITYLKSKIKPQKKIENSNINLQKKINSAIKYLDKMTKVKKSSQLVEIQVEWMNAKMGADIVNTYVAALSNFLNDNSMNINFQTIDPAIPPVDQYKPNLTLVLAITSMTSLLVAILFVFIKDTIVSSTI